MANLYCFLRKGTWLIFFTAVISSCVNEEDKGIIFCTDPLFPYFCPSSGKCCSLPVYGKNLNKCYATVSDCASSGQSCENCTIEPNNIAAKDFIYANWTCAGLSSQCEIDMGAPSGTAGPFCDSSTCMAWGDKFMLGGYSCDNLPANTPTTGAPPDGKCFKVGDF